MRLGFAWLATLGVQALLLVGLVAREEYALTHGTPVVLEVRAVDPMDLLTGRYVSVPLAIGRLDLGRLKHPEDDLQRGETVFVRLERAADVYDAVEVLPDGFARPAGIWARARVESSGASETTLDFGVDRFYISESARDPSIERTRDGMRHKISVAARIAKDGRVTIEDMLVDGESFAVWNARPLK